MPPDKPDAAYIWDMLDAAQAVQSFIQGRSVHDYLNDRMLRGAIERHVEIIGEAAGHVSTSLRDSHPEIPWKRIVAQRHVIAHEYGEIKHELLWKVAIEHIPVLIEQLSKLLS